jgi:hypothetical protein
MCTAWLTHTARAHAEQAVLVRCEAAKARLPFELRSGLVLTVEQSKGLEFDDVCTSTLT